MNRHLRNFLFFVLGFVIVSVPILTQAETIEATRATVTPTTAKGWATSSSIYYSGPWYATYTEAADALCASVNFGAHKTLTQNSSTVWTTTCTTGGSWSGSVYYTPSVCPAGSSPSGNTCLSNSYSCPVDGGWTLNGTTCTRPDPCPTSSVTSWYRRGKSEDISGSYCINNCSYSLGLDLSAQEFYESSSYYWMQYSMTGSGTSCSTNSSNVPSGSSTAPNQPPKDSPCGAGEGVISNSAGKVQCVPGGTNSGADTPKVTKTTSTDTKSDGSQTITNTTTTCTGAGACSTSTTVTITNNSSGQPGLAGTPGTSSSSSDKTPTEIPDFCKSAPNSQICKGGMATEATVEKINVNTKATVDELKKLTEPTVSDASAIENQTFANTTGRQELTDKDNELKNYVNGTTTDGGVSGLKSAWESAMSSGWWEPITLNGCAPFVMNFAGRTVTIDHCEKAAQIAQLGAYALWVVLLISTFVMLTGGRKA